ncbi:MAG: hypothetical protein ACO1RT_00235 [Planctomycetaceae bacterium]
MDRWKDRAMGAAPVLIMLAAIGVDYGWQPDGTTSQRGDNVQYIVQISPDQVQQLSAIGEITSTIDPSIQGRVSQIVVKVGTGPLPKDGGRVVFIETSTGSGKLAQDIPPSLDDAQVVPIPEIKDTAVRTNSANAFAVASAADRSASVMKPDPQGPGFQMPPQSATGAQSALDQVRSRAAEAANAFGSQPRNVVEPPSPTLPSNEATNRTALGAQNPINPLTVPTTARPSAGLPADSGAGRDDRWADLSARDPATTTAGPSTAPVDPRSRTAPWSDFVGPLRPNDPRSTTNAALTNPYANPAAQSGNAAASSATARDPSDPKWSGYGTSSNFGALPGGSNSPRTDYDPAAVNSATTTAASDPRLAPGASLPQGYVQDAQGNLFDSLGRPLDRNGQLIDPGAVAGNATPGQNNRYANPANIPGTSADPNGRRFDDYGRAPLDPRVASAPDQRDTATPPTAAPPSYGATNPAYHHAYPTGAHPGSANAFPATAADRFGTGNVYDPNAYSPPSYPQSPFGASTPIPQPSAAQQRAEQELELARAQLRSYQQRDAQAAQTRLTTVEDQGRSASDQRAATTASTRVESERTSTLPKPRSMSAQAFFNFVLLISFVGNAYLIFETNNLRRKFRNMISSVRSSKVTAQPVA